MQLLGCMSFLLIVDILRHLKTCFYAILVCESEVKNYLCILSRYFLLRTFITNCLILIFVIYMLKIPLTGKVVCLIASAVGASVCECVLLLLAGSYAFYKWTSVLVVVPLAARLAIGRQAGRKFPFLRLFGTMYVCNSADRRHSDSFGQLFPALMRQL